ncbi:MAG: tail fiber protein, partial [Tardiphaga sp.]
WAPCNGQLMSIQQNQALISLLGVTYGGDGRTTFALPDLRGRAILGGGGTDFLPGAISGTETVSMTVDQLPSHTHGLQASTTKGAGRGGTPTANVFGENTAPANSIFTPVGGTQVALQQGTNLVVAGFGTPHNNMQPYLVLNYVIALSGVFPSRQ